jgi:hypothetical protein
MAEKTGSSFYEELIKEDFYQASTSKQASSGEEGLSKEAAKSMLDSFSSDQLEALAQEFDDMIGKTASDSTLEDDILEVLAKEDGEDDKEKGEKKEFPFKKKTGQEKEDKGEKGEKPEGSKADEKEDKKEGESEDDKEKKEADEDLEDQILKEACDQALAKMTEMGLTVADYAYSRFEDAETAVFIADKAEKLAFITEQNPLIVVDDIINSIESKFTEE